MARNASTPHALPIEPLKGAVLEHTQAGPLVLSAPTGSGKSTQVPRWCQSLGRVLVVEPRRVACRSLAQRVASLEGTALGDGVGYHVRGEARSSAQTKVLFATTGIVLKRLSSQGLADFDTLIIDEFHERSLDIDLILALAMEERQRGLVVMSATIEGDRVARHLGGVHLRGEGRTFPITTRHVPMGAHLPQVKGLEDRILKALTQALGDEGDVLVFLPGKGEISGALSRLGPLARSANLELIPLHGGLNLKEQGRAFDDYPRRKVILATNVAETSITLPGIRVVIDSGLARQTRYRQGRGYLGLVPIAQDSAKQRAGRGGRMAPGVCYQLWDGAARLEDRTRPEVYRESLVPLVLATAACGHRLGDLRFLDPPKGFAIEAAEADLAALGALTPEGQLTGPGRRLFGLPLDAQLGRLLVEAQGKDVLHDMIDLVSVLAVNRPLFRPGPRPEAEEDDLRLAGCDATAAILAIRRGEPRRHQLNAFTLSEARNTRRRLRSALAEGSPPPPKDAPPDRRAIAIVAMAADPRFALIARRRKREAAWAGSGTEHKLGRESALNEDKAEALLAFESRALGVGHRDQQLIITCAMPIPIQWLEAAGLGEERVREVSYKGKKLIATVERLYANRVIGVREVRPTGAQAREAILALILRGSIFRGARKRSDERLKAAALHRRLVQGGVLQPSVYVMPWAEGETIPDLPTFLAHQLLTLGVESGEDIALLTEEDLTAPPLPPDLRESLDRAYPRSLSFPDADYHLEYDLKKKVVTLEMVKGGRKEPPLSAWLPALKGFKVVAKHKNVLKRIR